MTPFLQIDGYWNASADEIAARRAAVNQPDALRLLDVKLTRTNRPLIAMYLMVIDVEKKLPLGNMTSLDLHFETEGLVYGTATFLVGFDDDGPVHYVERVLINSITEDK